MSELPKNRGYPPFAALPRDRGKNGLEWAAMTDPAVRRVGVVLKTSSSEATDLGRTLLAELDRLGIESVIDRESAEVLEGNDQDPVDPDAVEQRLRDDPDHEIKALLDTALVAATA